MRPVNGANVILLNPEKKILCVKANYEKKQWMLPGGGQERGEVAKHAASTELSEETGIVVREQDLTLIALLTQRAAVEHDHELDVGGLLALYTCSQYARELRSDVDEEIALRQFFGVEEIVDMFNKGEFGRGYARMILIYHNILHGHIQPVWEARLSDPVPYLPKLII